MINAKEAQKMVKEVVKEKEIGKLKTKLEEYAMRLESVLILNPVDYEESLTDMLYELGCSYILHDGNVVVHLYDYEVDNSFMHKVYTKVDELKGKLEKDAEEVIVRAAKSGKNVVVYGIMGKLKENEINYLKNVLEREDYHVIYNQEGDMVISW
jgi:hypothetical protein